MYCNYYAIVKYLISKYLESRYTLVLVYTYRSTQGNLARLKSVSTQKGLTTMKNLSIKTVEKGTDNIKQLIVVAGVPESIEELAEFAAAQPQNVQDRIYKLFTAGFEAKAKSTFGEGTTDVGFETVLTRSGRRTQAGLLAAIGELIVDASTKNPVVIPQLVALMTKATASFKGHTDEYYDEFDEIKKQVVEGEETD